MAAMTLQALTGLLIGFTQVEKAQASTICPKLTSPLVVLYGRESNIHKPKLVRITSKSEWEALWNEHTVGNTELPTEMKAAAKIDFSRLMVIAVFYGDGSGCSGVDVDSVQEDDERLTIRIMEHRYQFITTPRVTPRPNEPLTYRSCDDAWGIFVLPRINKEIVLEQDETGTIGQLPKWAKWKQIAPIPAK